MEYTRRSTLGALGSGLTLTLAGCLSAPGSGSTITETETVPLAVRSTRPAWHDEGVVGHAVLIGSDEDQAVALEAFDLPGERVDAIESSLEGLDHQTERLLLVESVGPSACYRTVEFENVRLIDGTLRATARVVKSGDKEACATVITYPSALLRVTVDGTPPTDAEITIHDGWGDQETDSVSAGDGIDGLVPESS
ncbi:hypothetical protein RH831_07425 [Halodesulfurarchaeum sp. HSR-GB]|uniref:hypothetical protein n=1 Tax=Halodesulfurarchaeum sp. HSR-GB TaxID=3074077 RepID=UPI0028564930|nr:hypothetical protein [Halodesulfurarchaeum sp. HSR-GB]MDR5657011.1 hypothetical protein [Halodesulfurarchaeum sp. HSR-GB]